MPSRARISRVCLTPTDPDEAPCPAALSAAISIVAAAVRKKVAKPGGSLGMLAIPKPSQHPV